MTLMDYCMQYIDEIMDGRRPAPEGITLTETDPVARGMELLQKVGDFPTLVRLCAAQDGTRIPQEVYDSFDPGAAVSIFLGRDGEQESPQESTGEQEEPQPDPDAGKHAFQVLLDCVALDDGLVQYLTQVLRDRDWAGFYKLSQITTKMDLDPEEFLFWLGNKELWADDEERASGGVGRGDGIRQSVGRRNAHVVGDGPAHAQGRQISKARHAPKPSRRRRGPCASSRGGRAPVRRARSRGGPAGRQRRALGGTRCGRR